MQRYLQVVRNVVQFWKNGFNNEPMLVLNMIETSGSKAASFTIQDLMGDGMLWGVPKKRPTLERRLKQRFGLPNYQSCTRLIKPRQDVIICESCGDHHEAFTICRTCYNEVKEETDKLKKEIKDQTDPMEPKEQEVYLKYENDDANVSSRFRIVEVARQRPAWFAKNLMTKANAAVSESKSAIFGNDTPIIESRKK